MFVLNRIDNLIDVLDSDFMCKKELLIPKKVEPIYYGKKPNWDINKLSDYKKSVAVLNGKKYENSPKSVPIDINIVSKAFKNAEMDFSQHRSGVQYVIDLNLDNMIERIVFEGDIENEQQCHYAINEYKKFLIIYLYLKAKEELKTGNKCENYLVVPSILVDRLWHWHLLNLEAYMSHCKAICGHAIYHIPKYNVSNKLWLERFNECSSSYQVIFGYKAPDTLSTYTDCGHYEIHPSNKSTLKLEGFEPPYFKKMDINAIKEVFEANDIKFGKLSDGILYLLNLDLSYIVPRMIHNNGYNNEAECYYAINEYKKYLLIYIYLREKSRTGDYHDLVPPYPVDLVWHCHILDMQKYVSDCNKSCGEIVWHNPRFYLTIQEFPGVQIPKYQKLLDSYPIIFKKKPPVQMWGVDGSIAAPCCGGGN